MINKIKVLIADGSPTYRQMFAQAVKESDQDAVITYASGGGHEILDSIKRPEYDIIIVDAEFPGLDAIKFLRHVTLEIPKAYVLMTARPAVAEKGLFSEVLSKGAVDYIIKPIYNSYNENLDVIKNKLADIFKILHSAGIKNNEKSVIKSVRKSRFCPEIVLVAASTGGPMALKTILSKLDAKFPVPILVVQHMPSHFTETMTNHLDQNSSLKVKIAENRESVNAGTVYTAPGGIHMKLDRTHRIYFEDSPPVNGVRPSADVLFESVAESFSGAGVLVVILTGMGSDGQKGVEKLKKSQNCYCLAQSEKTCVVYGMPRSVAINGLADKIVDLDDIAREIESFNFTPSV